MQLHCLFSVELLREKTHLLTCCTKKYSNQLTHPQPVFLVHIKKLASLAIQNVPSEDLDQTAQMQTDLNLHWGHIYVRRYIFLSYGSNVLWNRHDNVHVYYAMYMYVKSADWAYFSRCLSSMQSAKTLHWMLRE